MENKHLQREAANIVGNVDTIICHLMAEIEVLESDNDKLKHEIEALKDIINDLKTN